MLKARFFSIFLFLFLAVQAFAFERRIAVTLDDLPFVGDARALHLNMIIDALQTAQIPATGFVIASRVGPSDWPLLKKFKEAGLGLGNHTWSHANLSRMSLSNYLLEIDKADKLLTPVLTQPKYFRYPYLDMGQGEKKINVAKYLAEKKYQMAPITIDSKDFVFNQLLLSVPEGARRQFLEVLKPCYLDFIWQQTLKSEAVFKKGKNKGQAQILLIHANLLNAYVLSDIINLYQKNGFSFISLNEALNPQQMIARKAKAKGNLDRPSFFAWDEQG